MTLLTQSCPKLLALIRDLNWRKGQRVVVTKKGKKITIEDYEG